MTARDVLSKLLFVLMLFVRRDVSFLATALQVTTTLGPKHKRKAPPPYPKASNHDNSTIPQQHTIFQFTRLHSKTRQRSSTSKPHFLPTTFTSSISLNPKTTSPNPRIHHHPAQTPQTPSVTHPLPEINCRPSTPTSSQIKPLSETK